MEIKKLLKACVKLEGSDLHVRVGRPPMIRVDGKLRPMNREPICEKEIEKLCLPLLDVQSRNTLAKVGQLTFERKCRVEEAIYCFRIEMRQFKNVEMVATRLDA